MCRPQTERQKSAANTHRQVPTITATRSPQGQPGGVCPKLARPSLQIPAPPPTHIAATQSPLRAAMKPPRHVFTLVGKAGFEPARLLRHILLRHARLPFRHSPDRWTRAARMTIHCRQSLDLRATRAAPSHPNVYPTWHVNQQRLNRIRPAVLRPCPGSISCVRAAGSPRSPRRLPGGRT